MSRYNSAEAFENGVELKATPTVAVTTTSAVVPSIPQKSVAVETAAPVEDPTDAADLMSLAYQLNLRLTRENALLKKQLSELTSKHNSLVSKLEELRAMIGSMIS